MKIIVSRNHLFTKLRNVGRIVKSGKELAYSSFLFDFTDQILTVTGCDESGQISTTIECQAQDNVNVQFLLDSSTLLNSLKELPDQPLTIDVDNSFGVKIYYYNGRFEMQGSDATLFPIMSDQADSKVFSINNKILKKGLSLGKFAANDELRPIMATVNLSCKNESVSFAATNSTVLGIYEAGNNYPNEEINVNIPCKITKIISDLLNKEDDIKIEYDDRSIQFEIDGYFIKYRLFEGRYPNFRSVVPKNPVMNVEVNCFDLIAAINRVSIFADESSLLINLHIKGNNLILTSQSFDNARSAKEDIFLDTVYSEIEIGFKSSLLLDVMKSIDSDTCIMYLTESSKAALFTSQNNSDSQYVLMPMQINN